MQAAVISGPQHIKTYCPQSKAQSNTEMKQLIGSLVERNMAHYKELAPRGDDPAKIVPLNKDFSWHLMLKDRNHYLALFNRHSSGEVGDEGAFDTFQMIAAYDNLSAVEICQFFWDIKYRMEWEVAMDKAPVILEEIDPSTILIYSLFKTIWPAKARYSTFISHIYHQTDSIGLSPDSMVQPGDTVSRCMVLNHSVRHPDTVTPKSAIYMPMEVTLQVQTRLKPNVAPKLLSQVTRDDVYSGILYAICVDPGGWVPVTLARATAKREYPRFMSRLIKSCQIHFRDAPLSF